jgi:predicted O-methyltransferase YrrM
MSFKNLFSRIKPDTPPAPKQADLPVSDEPARDVIVKNWAHIAADPRYTAKRIPDRDGIALYRIVSYLQCERTMEIGYYSGASTIAITSALRDMKREPKQQHLALDLEDWNGGPENVQEAGLSEYVQFVTGDSSLTLPPLVSEGRGADFIFIDGNHRFDFCMIDFFYSDRMLRDGGILAFHDTKSDWPAVDKVVEFVEKNRAYEHLGLLGGLELYLKKRADFTDGKFDRDARLFVDF